jgi:hypothetical protein
MSIDVESNGLYGKPFAIGAVVYDTDGEEVDRFSLKANMPITEKFVIDEVLPCVQDIEEADSYHELLRRFTEFYFKYKIRSMIIVHMGYIVEAFLFREMHDLGFIHDFDGPSPMFDISSDLLAAHADPTSPDTYIENHGIDIEFAGGTHHPLYDAIVAAKVYMDLNYILL